MLHTHMHARAHLLSLTLAQPFASVVRLAEIFTLDVMSLFRVDCAIGGANYYTSLFVTTIGLMLFVFAIMLDRMTRV